MCTLTGELTQLAGASSELEGADLSMRTIAFLVVSVSPAPSMEKYSTVLVPSVVTANGTVYVANAEALMR